MSDESCRAIRASANKAISRKTRSTVNDGRCRTNEASIDRAIREQRDGVI